MLNKRLAREGIQDYKPKDSKSTLLQNLMHLVTDKKERVKKILSKPAPERSVEELNEVANLLSVTFDCSF